MLSSTVIFLLISQPSDPEFVRFNNSAPSQQLLLAELLKHATSVLPGVGAAAGAIAEAFKAKAVMDQGSSWSPERFQKTCDSLHRCLANFAHENGLQPEEVDEADKEVSVALLDDRAGPAAPSRSIPSLRDR